MNRSWPGTSTKATSPTPARAGPARSRARSTARGGAPPRGGPGPARSARGRGSTCRGRRDRRWRRRAPQAAPASVSGPADRVDDASSRSSGTVSRSSSSRPSWTCPSTGGLAEPQRRGELGRQRHGRALEGDTRARRHRRPRPTDGTPRHVGEPTSAASRSARAQQLRRVAGERARQRACRRPGQGRLEGGEGQLVDAQRAGERVPAQPVRRAPASPSSSPHCGPPSSLSPEAVTSVAPARSVVGASGSSGSLRVGREQAGADVGDDGDRRAAPARPPAPTR